MHDMKEYFVVVVVVKEKPIIPCGKFQRNDQTAKMFFIEFMHLKFYLGSAVGKENTTNPSDLSLSFHHPSKSQMSVCVSVTPTPERTKSIRP